MTRTELLNEVRLVLGETNPKHIEVVEKLINEFCDEMQEITDAINHRLDTMGSALDGVLRELRK